MSQSHFFWVGLSGYLILVMRNKLWEPNRWTNGGSESYSELVSSFYCFLLPRKIPYLASMVVTVVILLSQQLPGNLLRWLGEGGGPCQGRHGANPAFPLADFCFPSMFHATALQAQLRVRKVFSSSSWSVALSGLTVYIFMDPRRSGFTWLPLNEIIYLGSLTFWCWLWPKVGILGPECKENSGTVFLRLKLELTMGVLGAGVLRVSEYHFSGTCLSHGPECWAFPCGLAGTVLPQFKGIKGLVTSESQGCLLISTSLSLFFWFTMSRMQLGKL